MRVRWIADCRQVEGILRGQGEEYDFEDAVAQDLIAQGKAAAVEAPTAAAEEAEPAPLPAGSRRRRGEGEE